VVVVIISSLVGVLVRRFRLTVAQLIAIEVAGFLSLLLGASGSSDSPLLAVPGALLIVFASAGLFYMWFLGGAKTPAEQQGADEERDDAAAEGADEEPDDQAQQVYQQDSREEDQYEKEVEGQEQAGCNPVPGCSVKIGLLIVGATIVERVTL